MLTSSFMIKQQQEKKSPKWSWQSSMKVLIQSLHSLACASLRHVRFSSTHTGAVQQSMRAVELNTRANQKISFIRQSQHENAFERGKVHDTARERSKVNWRCINIITIKMCMMDGNLSKISTKFESVCGAVECFKMAALPVHWVQKHWKVSNRLRTRENVSHTFHKFFGWHTNDNCLSTQRNSCIFICYVISALGETIRSKWKMKWARHKFVFMSILCRVYFFISFFLAFLFHHTIPCLVPASCHQWKFNEYVNGRPNVRMPNADRSGPKVDTHVDDSAHPLTLIKSWKSFVNFFVVESFWFNRRNNEKNDKKSWSVPIFLLVFFGIQCSIQCHFQVSRQCARWCDGDFRWKTFVCYRSTLA